MLIAYSKCPCLNACLFTTQKCYLRLLLLWLANRRKDEYSQRIPFSSSIVKFHPFCCVYTLFTLNLGTLAFRPISGNKVLESFYSYKRFSSESFVLQPVQENLNGTKHKGNMKKTSKATILIPNAEHSKYITIKISFGYSNRIPFIENDSCAYLRFTSTTRHLWFIHNRSQWHVA